MTGYAHRSDDTSLGRVTIELRSVNSRFTDLQFRIGDDLRTVEPMLREQIAAAVGRGKVECRMQLRSREPEGNAIQLDELLIARLAQADARIRALAPDAAPMTVADYLRWQASMGNAAGSGVPGASRAPGASRGSAADGSTAGAASAAGAADTAGDGGVDGDRPAERLWPAVRPLVDLVLADFIASREREGMRLAATIVRQVEEMQEVVERLGPMVPELLAGAEARLTARLAEAMPQASGAISPEETFARIRQEVALLGLRSDVTEEFNRLTIHFAEVLRAVDHGGAVGKRLDFLTQELNREANTLASKASGLAVTDGAVALKLLIEQMREQVQNLE